MSKKPEKNTVTTASIKDQTAEFLKSGGSIEYVVKGKSGQVASIGAKQGQKPSSATAPKEQSQKPTP